MKTRHRSFNTSSHLWTMLKLRTLVHKYSSIVQLLLSLVRDWSKRQKNEPLLCRHWPPCCIPVIPIFRRICDICDTSHNWKTRQKRNLNFGKIVNLLFLASLATFKGVNCKNSLCLSLNLNPKVSVFVELGLKNQHFQQIAPLKSCTYSPFLV